MAGALAPATQEYDVLLLSFHSEIVAKSRGSNHGCGHYAMIMSFL